MFYFFFKFLFLIYLIMFCVLFVIFMYISDMNLMDMGMEGIKNYRYDIMVMLCMFFFNLMSCFIFLLYYGIFVFYYFDCFPTMIFCGGMLLYFFVLSILYIMFLNYFGDSMSLFSRLWSLVLNFIS